MHYITKNLSLLLSLTLLVGCTLQSKNSSDKDDKTQGVAVEADIESEDVVKSADSKKTAFVDKVEYDNMMMHMVNGDTTGLWPVANEEYPLEGAILPFKRIVAYYGNLYSKNMVALGEYPPKEMWSMVKD